MAHPRLWRAFALSAVLALAASAQQGAYKPYQEKLADGVVDWDEGWIRADASAPLASGVPAAQARVDARRVATVKAQAAALRIALRLPVNSERRLESYEALRVRVRGVVAGGTILSEGLEGQTYRLSLKVPVNGVTGLISEVSQVTLPPAPENPPAPSAHAAPRQGSEPSTQGSAAPGASLGSYASVTVDAAEAGARPALQARIVDPQGQEVYGAQTVAPEVARKKTFARYVTPASGGEAQPSAWLDPYAQSWLPLALAEPPWRILAQRAPSQKPRGQEQALEVKAVATGGPLKADLVVTEETAKRLRESAGGALADAKVVVVVRADVGGVEGRRLRPSANAQELARR